MSLDVLDIFRKADFNIEADFKQSKIFEDNAELRDKVLFFQSNNRNGINFYLLTTRLSVDKLKEIHQRIWNENKAHFIVIPTKEGLEFRYARDFKKRGELIKKVLPETGIVKEVQKWKFDSAAFWQVFSEFTDQIKNARTVALALVNALSSLKEKLSQVITDEKSISALIDRTLFIKYLEDNHIINSKFYTHFFGENIDYKTLLKQRGFDKVNLLYRKLDEIFNNKLLREPELSNNVLEDAADLIVATLERHIDTNQLSLFDFDFSIIPVEFISHIYEIFLGREQKKLAAYYTPPVLAKLIIDQVVDDTGTLLDPACGSGIFLIYALRKFIEKSEINSDLSVTERLNQLLQIARENIFGIELSEQAWRLSVLSLYLEILRNFKPQELKALISERLYSGNDLRIFSIDLSENILCQNTLDLNSPPFKDKKYRYIVGNPPFKKLNEIQVEERNFVESFELNIGGQQKPAKDFIENYQISQAFMLKVYSWTDENTKLGFVQNYSNFSSSKNKFLKGFLKLYDLEKFYEMSAVKNFLFKSASEPVVVTIFKKATDDNSKFYYYKIEEDLFAHKLGLLIIREDKRVEVSKEDILKGKLSLRDFLIATDFDFRVLRKIEVSPKRFKDFILKDNKGELYIKRGISVSGEGNRKFKNLTKQQWQQLTRDERKKIQKEIKSKFISDYETERHQYKFLKPYAICPFIIKGQNVQYISDKTYFHRPVKENIFEGKKILFPRTTLNAVYTEETLYFAEDVYVLKLKPEFDHLYLLFTALLNSKLIRYYIDLKLRKRLKSGYSKIGKDDIASLPFPAYLDSEIVVKINTIVQEIMDRETEFLEVEQELNGLIYDLYGLSKLERQRIEEYFMEDRDLVNEDDEIFKLYVETFNKRINFSLAQPVSATKPYINRNFNLAAIGFFTENHNQPSPREFSLYMLENVFKQGFSVFGLPEKIVDKDAIYIIKRNKAKNWTLTKGFEDAEAILKQL